MIIKVKTMKKILIGICLMLCVLLLVSCAPKAEEKKVEKEITPPSLSEEETGSSAVIHQVVIQNDQFDPESLAIKNGETVEWSNQDDTAHTVTFDNGEFDEKLPVGATASYTSTKSGNFDYHCSIHPSMQGDVSVN